MYFKIGFKGFRDLRDLKDSSNFNENLLWTLKLPIFSVSLISHYTMSIVEVMPSLSYRHSINTYIGIML